MFLNYLYNLNQSQESRIMGILSFADRNINSYSYYSFYGFSPLWLVEGQEYVGEQSRQLGY